MTGWSVLDLVGTQIVGFLRHRLNYILSPFQLPAGAVSMFGKGPNPLMAALKKKQQDSDEVTLNCVKYNFINTHTKNVRDHFWYFVNSLLIFFSILNFSTVRRLFGKFV